ncbi:hypothetical protein WJX72_001183 [[Myrmecia] bisecta]|uniref:F-box domain-containing protein n=1 Tax=[Myrmecia] bisecta TaxID=41462 RepID=A0AAW1Q3E1_9CHLO
MSALPERAEGWPGPGAYRFAGAVSGCAAGVSLAVAETLKALRTVQTSQNIWEDLPDDLLIEIFKRADLAQPQAVRQRCQVGLVCRKWNAALESGKFWKAITLDMNEFDSPEAVSAALQGCARRATQPDCTLRIERLIDECSRLLYSITSPDLDPVISALSLLSLFK